MIRWTARPVLYQFATVFNYLVFLVFAVGFSVPMWLGKDPAIVGLWAFGLGDDSEIDHIEGSFFDEGLSETWFDAVRGLMLAGMAFYVIAVLVSVVENCFLSPDVRDYGATGISTMLAGLCGCVAVIVTAAKVEDDDIYKNSYRWGYMLTAIASGLAVLTSLVLLITRNTGLSPEPKISRTADYVYGLNKPMPTYAPEYVNPGYRGDELPLVNGVPFHQPVTYGHSPYNMYPSANKYEHGSAYFPYGYKDQRPGNRVSMADAADLSNGFTPGMVQTDLSLGRRGEYIGPQGHRGGDYFYSGSRRY